MKTVTTLVAVFLLTACTAMYFPTNSGYIKNSIYYTSIDEVKKPVSDTILIETESYTEKLRKFDSPTYNVELNLTPWCPSYYWRFSRWALSPYVYSEIYWDWRWSTRYGYWGYYNPYKYYNPYRYRHSYRYYWDWNRPYYVHRPYHPSHRPGREVRYARRGGMVGPTPSYRSKDVTRSNRTTYKQSTNRPSSFTRTSTQRRSAPTRYSSGNQTQRTGYSRSQNTGRDYYRSSSSTPRNYQPSVRYNEKSTGSYQGSPKSSSGNGSGGSSTRRR